MWITKIKRLFMWSKKEPIAKRALKRFRDKKAINSGTLKLFTSETKDTLNQRFTKAIKDVEKLRYGS